MCLGIAGPANDDMLFSAATVAKNGTAFGDGFKGQLDTGFMADPARDIFCCAVQTCIFVGQSCRYLMVGQFVATR